MGRAREEIAATDHTGARDRHAATENGRWPRGDRKYEGAVLITLPVTTDYVVSDSCLFSLETIERAMRGEFNNTQRTLYISSSFVPRYEIFKGKR